MRTIKSSILAITVFLSFLLCVSLSAQGFELREAVTITAEVYGVEKIDRTLWLIGPEGNIVEIDVSEDAKNFNQLEIGDLVNITYYESIAIYLGTPGELPSEETGEMIVRAPEGETPGGIATETTDISAVVQDIDKYDRLITLKGPAGNVFTTYVDESVRYFDMLKIDDVIHIRYTKSLAVSVELQE